MKQNLNYDFLNSFHLGCTQNKLNTKMTQIFKGMIEITIIILLSILQLHKIESIFQLNNLSINKPGIGVVFTPLGPSTGACILHVLLFALFQLESNNKVI